MRYLLIVALLAGCSAGNPAGLSDAELRERVFSVVRQNVSQKVPPAVAACIMDRINQSTTMADIRDELAYQERSGGTSSEKAKTVANGAVAYCAN